METDRRQVRGHHCTNGMWVSEEGRWAFDGRDIELCKVCDDCEAEKLSRYRPEILGYYDESDVDEDIDPE